MTRVHLHPPVKACHDSDEKVLQVEEGARSKDHVMLRGAESVESSVSRLHRTFISNPELYKEYQSSQREFFDFYAVGPLVVMMYTVAATRFNVEHLRTENSLLVAASALMIGNSCLFLPYVLLRMIAYYTPPDKRNWVSYKLCKSWLQLCYRGRIEDVVGILVTSCCGLCLLGRVSAGQCDATASVWSTQSCNPVADMHSIPGDQVILLYLLPLGVQCVMRGVSVQALVVCCLLSTFFVMLASVQVGGLIEAWTILYSLFFLIITLMVERLMIVIFMSGQATLASDKVSTTRAFEMLELSTGNERRLKQKEIFQLRSLMGNVAHDLKTPLHSIVADLEVLRLFMGQLEISNPDSMKSELHRDGCGVSVNVQSVFDSLTATCKFMAMAINRSQDFVKASNNIALVPALGTFEIQSAVAMSVNCMNHLQAARTIAVHPLDGNICSHVISDKHWLSENVLCLLSNALKYSDDGVVDLRMRLINIPSPNGVRRTSQLSHMEEPVEEEKAIDSSSMRFDDVASQRSSNAGGHSEISVCSNVDRSASAICGAKRRRMILVSVEDAGIGITEEARKNLFQSFQQAQRMAGGTGLGLYSLSKRVEALGGSNGVTGRSDGKQGSKFWFTFPYRPDEEAARLDAVHDNVSGIGDRLSLTLADFPRKRILLVDDSVTILKVTSRLLKMKGHEVQTAANGSLGLKMLKDAYLSQDFDMVLTDLQMPVMDGIEATRRYREFEAEQGLHQRDDSCCQTVRARMLIVGMSANSDSQSKEEAIESGMDYFLEKPFSHKDLCPILLSSQVEMSQTLC